MDPVPVSTCYIKTASHLNNLNVFVDPAVNAVAAALKEPTVKMFTDMEARFRAAAGSGVDDAIDLGKELSQSGFTGTTYFAWARRTAQ
jgi:hypothetical protein